MILRTKLLVLLSGLLLGVAGCQKFIEKPLSSTLVQAQNVRTVNELDILMTGAYAGISHGPGAHSGSTLLMGEMFADLVALNNTTIRTAPSNVFRMYNWTHRETDGGQIGGYLQWATFGLTNANTVLEVMRANQVQTPNEPDVKKDYARQRDRIEGEARFIRAMVLFEQTRLLGYPWGHLPDNGQPGPIGNFRSLSTFGDLAYPRLSVRVAYDSLFNDLRQAERLLPEAYDPAIHPADYQPRANKYAALALMARVYWQQDNVDSCLAVCNRLLGTGATYRFPLIPGNRLLTDLYQRSGITPTTNSSNRDEVIFELVMVTGQNVQTGTGGQLRTHYALQTPYTAAQLANVNTLAAGPLFRLSQRFKQLANFDRTRDLRYRALIDTTQAAMATTPWDSPNRLWFTRKWGLPNVGTTAPGVAQGVNINVIQTRSAEFILMRAEMNARKGNVAAALADLNAIRVRAGLPALATAPANLLAEVRTEFVRELVAEGFRFHDLRRRREAIDPADRATSPGGLDCQLSNCQPVPWNSRLLMFQVPNAFLSRNPLAIPND
jgi:hypothetical protein